MTMEARSLTMMKGTSPTPTTPLKNMKESTKLHYVITSIGSLRGEVFGMKRRANGCCLKGYRPKDEMEWGNGNWSSGCIRNAALQCHRNSSNEENNKKDGFLKLQRQKATENFHSSNKLGEGGFGLVYKGVLEDGQEIAVKRLSESSAQGQKEFMNEVIVISKLQHRNLVRLLGCCIERGEKMLVYEFMPKWKLGCSSLWGSMGISEDGNLVVWDGEKRVVWSTSKYNISPANTTAQLLDSGNLVLKDSSSGRYLWTSFIDISCASRNRGGYIQ
nr:G-type lectin S-receptor-like serine/threonine-protein kinase At1g11300 isoform X1 [Ipomoea batatas]